ncbi:ATP-binding protein [Variovorax sp. CCNWLW235]|uniref:ATP-binding protein n=1 Tax=Variovorax sp. CCNWLW235 TaxID=3127463 RepID=UPI003076F367
MSFQAGVSAWFAAHLLSRVAIGTRFGQGRGAVAERLQFETGRNLDDIEVHLSDGSLVSVQCKTNVALSSADGSDLASVVKQLISLYRTVSTTGEVATGVLAVSVGAPASLDDLNRACRMFDFGGAWAEVYVRVNKSERGALDIFRHHIARLWANASNDPCPDAALADMARLFRLVRFDIDPGGADWREAAATLQNGLFGDSATSETAMAELQRVAQELIRKGAPSDRDGWLRSIRKAGIHDRRAPGFDADIEQLRQWTSAELDRLKRHAFLAGDAEIPRQCLPPLREAIENGSLLVVGEPGAGKTGVLVRYARELFAGGAPIVFLSVDDLSATTDASALRRALDIENDLLDVLGAWPGTSPAVLVIDALDASRGGASEAVFARLIEGVVKKLGERWSVVASIRTFDLRHGKRLRALMQGKPPDEKYAEAGLESVRHFSIPRLVDAELTFIGEANPTLGRLLSAAPTPIRKLLGNVFNLSLAAELVSGGLAPEAIQGLTSQSQLISRYEDERLNTHRLRRVAAEVVGEMARQEHLVVKQDRILNDALDEVIATGVLIQAPQDRVSFAHHVLFDHAVGRFYLDLDDADALTAQVAGQPAIGLLLGPGLRFAIMDKWETGPIGKEAAWQLAAGLASHNDMDPVLGSIALRTVIDSVQTLDDVQPLSVLVSLRDRWPQTGYVLSRASRFVRVNLLSQADPGAAPTLAWAEAAHRAAMTGATEHLDGVRILLLTLMERGNFEDANFATAFGAAARLMLATVWSDEKLSGYSSTAIRFVARAFESDPAASERLLQQVISEPHFSSHASQEAPWLAEGARYMLNTAPAFVEQIYASLFGKESPQQGDTFLGGPSKILPLRSNHKQDYEHARWHLEQVLPKFLQASPTHATRAVSSCVIGLAAEEQEDGAEQLTHVPVQGAATTLTIVDDSFSLEEWREAEEHEGTERRVLTAFVDFLRSCSEDDFRRCTDAALGAPVSSSVVARLFGVAAERPGVADDRLWPVATDDEVMLSWRLSRDAIAYIASVLPIRPTDQRVAFERRLLERVRSSDDDVREQWEYRAKRLLSLIEPTNLLSPELGVYQTELSEQGDLTGNPAYISISTAWAGGDEDIVDTLLHRQGVDTNAGPDGTLMESVRPLKACLKASAESLDRAGVTTIWTHIQNVVVAIDRQGGAGANPETGRAAWGYVSNGAVRIAESDAYKPGDEGNPATDQLLTLLDRLSESPYPEASSEHSRTMAWGNWDVRVYAAQGYLALARKGQDASFEPRFRRMLIDPVPAVRHQISCALNALWDVAKPTMWQLMEFVAEHETHPEVLAFFVSGPMRRTVGAAPDRCAAIVSKVLRLAEANAVIKEGGRSELAEAVAGIAAHLWLGQGHATAKQWINGWVANLSVGSRFVGRLISELRRPLFVKWDEKIEAGRSAAIQNRSKDLLSVIVDAQIADLNEAKALFLQGEQELAAQLYRRSGQQLEHAANQLYFGSGASSATRGNSNFSNSLSNKQRKEEFIVEYGDILRIIGDTGISSIVYHLVELYEFLAEASPEVVFDRIAELLIGPASRDGYQFESLAETALVRLVQMYLADYRSVFADNARREQLVKVLELFSRAGAPEALRLLYELPDLLR